LLGVVTTRDPLMLNLRLLGVVTTRDPLMFEADGADSSNLRFLRVTTTCNPLMLNLRFLRV